jgi:hypothetical protein
MENEDDTPKKAVCQPVNSLFAKFLTGLANSVPVSPRWGFCYLEHHSPGVSPPALSGFTVV